MPCERAFSSSGLTGTDCRNRLSPEVFEALQLLKHAYRTDTITVEDEIKDGDDLVTQWVEPSDEEEADL